MTKLGPYLLGPNDTPENGIYTGDAKELSKDIPDNSVDLIFADPEYDKIEDYEWLAKTAAKILKNDSACLAWTGTPQMPKCINAMLKHLDWAWCLYWHRIADRAIYPGKAGITVITPCLWFQKGHSKTKRKMADMGQSKPVRGVSYHKWSKPFDIVRKWLNAFVSPGDVVFDPFAGSGPVPAMCSTLGVSYLALEIDPETAVLARELVRGDLPLFGSTQIRLF